MFTVGDIVKDEFGYKYRIKHISFSLEGNFYKLKNEITGFETTVSDSIWSFQKVDQPEVLTPDPYNE